MLDKNEQKDYEESVRISKYFDATKNLPWNMLKNDKFGRVLTDQEIVAIKWWSTFHNGVGPKHPYYDNAIRSLIISIDVSSIMDEYKKYAGNTLYEEMLLMSAQEQKEL